MDTQQNFPLLDHVRVLDLSRAMAGPYCTMMLGDLGAEVIKVEPPPNGDESRSWGPPFLGGESAYFLSVNRNKKSIVIDLKHEEGRAIVLKLAQISDVVVENFRPGTVEKLGVDYKSLSRINPKLIYCSISGFGQTGYYREKPGYDIIALAMSGMMSIMGEEGRPPIKAGVPISDIGAGMFAAFAIVCCLFRRHANNMGEYIDVSLTEGQMAWLTNQAGYYFATGKNPQRTGSAHQSIVPYQAFKGSDDEYFVVAVANDELYVRFCNAIHCPELLRDPRFATNQQRVTNREELVEKLSRHFLRDTAENWISKISSAGVPCSMINNLERIFSDPFVSSRNIVKECEHTRAGKIRLVAPPYHFQNFFFSIRYAPPLLGEHTREVLLELGYDIHAIEDMISKGVVR
jgi:crotonobetainyl-CoA:carnitine CoA-transferase CaiB-like acyl-CoA transferase